MLPLGGRPLVMRAMQALAFVPADVRILASTEDCEKTFTPLAEEAGFIFFAGNKDDVLERYCAVIRHFNVDCAIRATGDNPFVFADAAAALCAESRALGSDYAGYSGLPFGAGVEAVNAAALLLAGKEATERYDREHVCPYLYGKNGKFLQHRPLAPLRWQGSGMRITVDTQEDYEKAKVLYAALEKYENSVQRYQGMAVIKTYKEVFTD